jgi:hypothetical protein
MHRTLKGSPTSLRPKQPAARTNRQARRAAEAKARKKAG